MQKVRKMNRKISALILSVILVFSMIVIPSAKKIKNVYAYGNSTDFFEKWAMAQIVTKHVGKTYFNPDNNEKPDIETAIIYEALKQEDGELTFQEFYELIESDFVGEIFTKDDIKDTLNKMDSPFVSYNNEMVTFNNGEVKGSDTCHLIGEAEDANNTIVYGIWTNNTESSASKEYIALEFDSGYRIKKYRKVDEQDISVGFKASGYDYENDEDIDYMRTKDGKSVAVIPYFTSAICYKDLKIEGRRLDTELNMVLSKSSPDDYLIELQKEEDEDYKIATYNEPEKSDPEDIICEYQDEDGNVIVKGKVPCYVLKMAMKDVNRGYGINIEPTETITLKARIKGYPTQDLTYKWESKEFSDINGKTTESISFTAPKKSQTGSITLNVYTKDGELLETDSENVTVEECKISFNAMDMKTGKLYAQNENLQLDKRYILGMKGANFGWAMNNSDDEFEQWTFVQNGKKLTIDYKGEVKGDASFIDLEGDVGGDAIPHEVVIFKESGKVTITGTIKRNGKEFKSGSTTFNVGKMSQTITASDITKTYSTKKQTASLNVKVKDKAQLSYKSDNKNITVDSKGKITIKAKYIGSANITITSKETANYKAGKKVVKVTVNPTKTTLSSVKNKKSKTMTVTWKKNMLGSGYQIQYSTDKNFAKGNKTKSISTNKTTSYTLSKLTKKKTYYVRIRTAKKVSKKTYYSSWSSAKKVKINK